MKTYKIGDKVWYAEKSTKEEIVTCPECFGKKHLTVILGDDSKVTIDCAGCSVGYEPPRGYVTYHKQDIDVRQIVIDGVEINRDSVKYKFDQYGCGYRIAYSTDVFSTKEKAKIRAKELVEEHNRQELERIHRKEKNHRTWAWHVHYYRNMIRHAEKEIERARLKLDVAKEKQKQEKEK